MFEVVGFESYWESIELEDTGCASCQYGASHWAPVSVLIDPLKSIKTALSLTTDTDHMSTVFVPNERRIKGNLKVLITRNKETMCGKLQLEILSS